MKFGIIGYQHFHIDAFINMMCQEGHIFAGVFDEDIGAAKKCAEKYNVPVLNNKSCFLQEKVDIIGIGDIPAKRIDVLKWCEDNSIHAVSDKALVINERGLEILRGIVKRNKIKFSMILDFRYHPLSQKLKEEIDNKTFGELCSLDFMVPHKLRQETRPAWFWKPELAGTIITDLMIHSLDLFAWFTSSTVTDFTVASARKLKNTPEQFMDYASASLISANNVHGNIYVDWLTPDNYYTWSDARIFCRGTEGFAEIRLTGDGTHAPPALIICSTQKPATEITTKNPNAVTLAQDITSQIAGKAKPFLSASDILDASELTIKLNEKHNNGEKWN
ncbi:MAG: hypothetical protein A2017_05250 [Lentisphaerae bacterium GWF2_44_16]|nr:MAG: hypothetical protein A2017_05250 [Lentisphaerae bacterium GWF2_44_16]